MLPEELLRLLISEINRFSKEISLPSDWNLSKRFEELTNIIVPSLISTPRDVKRLVGTYHVISELVGDDVSWEDVFAYSVLQSKSEDVISNIRDNPESVVDDPLDIKEQMSRYGLSDDDSKVRLEKLIDVEHHAKDADTIRRILMILFPIFNGGKNRDGKKVDDICHRRPLMTALRLGLIPSSFSRKEVISVLKMNTTEMCQNFRKIWDEERFVEFFSRLEDIYLEEDFDTSDIWYASSDFFIKDSSEWDRRYSGRPELARAFARMFERKYLISRSTNTDRARDLFEVLLSKGDTLLTTYFLRSHIFTYGLFSREKSERIIPFLEKEEVEEKVLGLAKKYKENHLKGDWIMRLVDSNPLYLILDTGQWDKKCRDKLRRMVEGSNAIDALALLFFGGIYSTDKKTIDQFVGWDWFTDQVSSALDGDLSNIHETAIGAMKKAQLDL